MESLWSEVVTEKRMVCPENMVELVSTEAWMAVGILECWVDVGMVVLPVESRVGPVEKAEKAIVATSERSAHEHHTYKVPTDASSTRCSTEVWACYLSVRPLSPWGHTNEENLEGEH